MPRASGRGSSAHHDHPGEDSVDADEDAGLAGAMTVHYRPGFQLLGRDAVLGEEATAADRHPASPHRPGDALAGVLPHLHGLFEPQLLLARRLHQRRPQDVGRHAVHRCRQREHLGAIEAGAREDLPHLRRPHREGAGLVEEDRAHLAQGLDCTRPLDDHALACRARETGDEGDRSGATRTTASPRTASPPSPQAAPAMSRVAGKKKPA